ncbi:hypothetical protein K504DRAFT_495416 [Pleomassaria siparia CBS 279.74]|uniref:Vacuolar membrane-associated protein IML1 n=1 Tax=Pleomassaria siparia CBS 279.74 TaxID=1314801 RepID=A0A6G1JTQ4_9PLEO|nr:hypothetical protein K504DRAFT_495416 [Pleomassaria siparia CBS 279.74]
MSKSVVSVKRTRVQKVCTLWVHDENFSKDDVVFNGEKFPELPATPGSLIQIMRIKQATTVRDFQATSNKTAKDTSQSKTDDSSKDGAHETHSRRTRRGSVVETIDENGLSIPGGREVVPDKSYIFVATATPTDLRSKYSNLQVSISEKIAKVFGFRNRVLVVVTLANEERHSASHVEVTFRDQYLARADMWRISIAELSNRTVYRGQKLLFMGTIKATIKNVYNNGQSTHSGYFSSTTKPVFRSESARYVLFIQMSKEMWDFDAEGAGEIMFNKIVNGFLPDLFKRWMKISARHLVTIILFTRMQYDGTAQSDRPDDTTNNRSFGHQTGRFRDYYRVVVSDMASGDWINILYQLKKEFRQFLRDVSLVPKSMAHPSNKPQANTEDPESELMIAGKPSTASHGNILEAINLASAQFAKDYIDRDLVRTGISVVIVTAGTGVYEVDYNMLKLTTDTLVGSGVGIDLVSLSPMPLHSVPLFKYRSPRLMSTIKPTTSEPNESQRDAIGDELDEKTPRQHQINFGPLGQKSPALSHSILSSHAAIIPPIEEGDDWRYAMPHWVDISFWSGPSDEIVELTKPKKLIKSAKKSQKKSGTFALRCRMYELQMMGVMESERGAISIPYLEEDPLYPHQLRDDFQLNERNRELPQKSKTTEAGSKGQEEEHSDRSQALHKAWMEAYDDFAFAPLMDREAHFGQYQDRDQKIEASTHQVSPQLLSKNAFSPPSFRSVAQSFGQTARPPPEAQFHQLMRERSREMENQSPRGGVHRFPEAKGQSELRTDTLNRQMSHSRTKDFNRPSLHKRGGSGDLNDHRRLMFATPNDSPAVSRGNTPPKRSGLPPLPITASRPPIKSEASSRPGGWFLRQISFGGKGKGASNPTTSVATIDITPGKVKPARLIVENNQKGAIAEMLASTKVTSTEKPSKPINIRAASRAGVPSADSVSPDPPRSVGTVRGPQSMKTSIPSQPGSVSKNPGSTFLVAGSRTLTLPESTIRRFNLSSSGGARQIPRTLSPTSAIAPWAVLVNPCNPKRNNVDVANQFRRWQHVFPKRLRTSSVKWKSLCSPAAVPLTNGYFPTPEQLATEYNESPYKITQNDDDEMLETPKSRESLIRELVAFRLSHGFQIIVGSAVADFSGGRERDLSNIFHSEYMSHDGDTVFMCVGNNIHQLVCVAGGEVEVKRFSRKPTTALQTSAGIDTPFPYKPFIRTALEDGYRPRDVVLRPPRGEYNWNFIDTFLAGYHDEFSEVLRFWRARFVLIPVELPAVSRRGLPPLHEDSEEEVRLEGIRKLTQLWQKNRYVPTEERHFQATTSKLQRDPNPLAIEYHTRDPSAIVAAGTESVLLTDADSEFQTSLFSETDQYNSSNIDIKKLAEDLQGEKGIRMLDRRWHWKLHYNCFLGFDLTSWLQLNFKDIDTRDEAVDLGNQLMNKGLFVHVHKRHQFRDGNFFFQIAEAYRAPRPESRTGWFGMRRNNQSIPSTPLSEGPRSSPLAARSLKSRPSTSDSSSASGSERDGEKTPTRAGSPKRKVTLSRVMRYDVDSRKRSYRPEIISLHYDRLHNPDNCYHIRIDWMNVTAKLIEDSIVTWATSVEKYGLKLVEVPIAEASDIIDHHPFRSPYSIKLALQPPQSQPEQIWDISHLSPQYAKTDRFAYHKALLRKLNFVLDMEAASAFPPDVDVTYSWGNPDYKYPQFIHRSGVLLAQITHDGNFLLLANRLAHNRSRDNTRIRATDPYEHKRTGTDRTTNPPPTPAERANPHRSPFSSPLARPVQDSSLLHTALQERNAIPPPPPIPQTPEQIKDEIEIFCTDATLLKSFYDSAFPANPSPSPHLFPVMEHNIPILGLPPAISIREASPASGWGLGSSLMSSMQGSGIAGRRSEGGGWGGVIGAGGKKGSVDGGSLPRRQDSQGSVGSGV